MADEVARPVRFPLLPVVVSTLVFCLLVGLGIWQMLRLGEKEALIARVTRQMEQPPVPLTALVDDIRQGDIEFRPVTVTGVWQHADTFFVGPRYYLAANGYHVVTPLRLKDGRNVLVNRGWIPDKQKADWIAAHPTDEEKVTVEGIVRIPRKVGWFVPDNSPQKNHWFWEDLPAMQQRYGAPLLPVIVASTMKGEARYPVPMAASPRFRNDHLHYAMTWFALAIAVAVMFALWLRGYYRKESA